MGELMEKPTCRCGQLMAFLLNNRVTDLWACPDPSCGRILLKQKTADTGTFYKKEVPV